MQKLIRIFSLMVTHSFALLSRRASAGPKATMPARPGPTGSSSRSAAAVRLSDFRRRHRPIGLIVSVNTQRDACG